MVHLVLEFLIILTTIGSWVRMFKKGGGRVLSQRGLESLKYYTCLSNIFAGLISGLTIVCLLVTGMQVSLPMWVALLKYSAAVSVCLTFCVVMVFLGPRMGYKLLFAEEQLFLHAVGPLLAVFSFLSSPFIPQMKSSATFIAVIPTLLYGIVYAANILKNGIGEGEKTNDWYGFAVGGVKSIPIVFAIIMTVTWGMAVGMLALRGVFQS
ncbi:MAG: hypothetical protein IKF10_02810 [Lachnospiraceae bacterium]|nr:hypothetical protein [Lachnospiraceae bacterium]